MHPMLWNIRLHIMLHDILRISTNRVAIINGLLMRYLMLININNIGRCHDPQNL